MWAWTALAYGMHCYTLLDPCWSKLLDTIESLYLRAYDETEALIPSTSFSFSQRNNDGREKHYKISSTQFLTSLKNKYGAFDHFKKNLIDHLLGLKQLTAAFASTPTAFSDAWNMKSENSPPMTLSLSRSQAGIFSSTSCKTVTTLGLCFIRWATPRGWLSRRGLA